MLVGRDTSDSDFNTILKTGGEKKHTLSVEEMPSHDHTLYVRVCSDALEGGHYTDSMINNCRSTGFWSNDYNSAVLDTGGSQAHNNLQPYIVVYRWRRIA